MAHIRHMSRPPLHVVPPSPDVDEPFTARDCLGAVESFADEFVEAAMGEMIPEGHQAIALVHAQFRELTAKARVLLERCAREQGGA